MRIGVNGYCLKKKTGIGSYARLLLKELLAVDKKNEYFLFTPKKMGHGLKAKNLKEIYYPAERPWKMLYWENFVLPRIVREKKIDLFFSPNFSLPLTDLDCKKVVTVHDIAFKLFPQYVDLKGKLFYALNAGRSMDRADKIIADSVHTKQDLIKHFDQHNEKIKVIYFGLDKSFKPIKNKKAKQALMKKYRLKEPFILYLGMQGTRKNLVRLVQAFKAVGGKHAELNLVLAGSPVIGYEKILKEVKRQGMEGKVKSLEHVPYEEIPLLINCAKLLVHPSLYEGFGLPVLEAMQCGVPVACAKNSSLPEVGGHAVAYFNELNVRSIARVINESLEKKRSQELSRKGLRQAKKFSARKMAVETLRAFKKVMA